MKNADKQVEHHNPNKKAVPCMSETELKQLPFTSQSVTLMGLERTHSPFTTSKMTITAMSTYKL